MLRQEWVDHGIKLSHRKADLYAGARKILHDIQVKFTALDNSLELNHCGFTSNKMGMLKRNYLHPESIKAAEKLWTKRRSQEKYGSVGFTTYNHFEKGNIKGASPRGSVMGPCIQSVIITLVDKKRYRITVPYRTTEYYKKFPADLIFLRDVLLPPFDVSGLQCEGITCHFANITCHSMYLVTLLPSLDNSIEVIRSINKKDPYFANWVIKWTARYLCPEYSRGIQKFSQALRVRKDALERLDKKKLRALQTYLRNNHPGYRNDTTLEEEDE